MTATAHALVAGAIAAHFSDPVTAATIAFTSHFVMDSIPHWDFGTDWRNRPKHETGALAITETLFGIGIALIFFRSTVALPLLMLTIIASVLPDWLETPWYIFFAKADKHGPAKRAGVMERLTYGLYKIPNVFHSKTSLPFGLVTQVVTVIFFLSLLK